MAVNVDTAAQPVARPQAVTGRRPEHRRGPEGSQVLLYLVLFGLSALFMFPFAWLILTSLRAPADVFDPNLLPDPWYFANYSRVFDEAPVARWLWNSFFVAAMGVIAVLFSSSLVAYGF